MKTTDTVCVTFRGYRLEVTVDTDGGEIEILSFDFIGDNDDLYGWSLEMTINNAMGELDTLIRQSYQEALYDRANEREW